MVLLSKLNAFLFSCNLLRYGKSLVLLIMRCKVIFPMTLSYLRIRFL